MSYGCHWHKWTGDDFDTACPYCMTEVGPMNDEDLSQPIAGKIVETRTSDSTGEPTKYNVEAITADLLRGIHPKPTESETPKDIHPPIVYVGVNYFGKLVAFYEEKDRAYAYLRADKVKDGIDNFKSQLAAVTAERDKVRWALECLYALVNGEVPSILEDNHHDDIVREALESTKAKT